VVKDYFPTRLTLHISIHFMDRIDIMLLMLFQY